MERPEHWPLSWIVLSWVLAAGVFVLLLQLADVGGSARDSRAGSHVLAFLISAGSILLVAGPFYVTQRWLTGRERNSSAESPEDAGGTREEES